MGSATATSGGAIGVGGQSDSTDGAGIYGWALATSGTAQGVFGETRSNEGQGVAGWAAASSGRTAGVYGSSDSPDGIGSVGWSSGSGVLGFSGPKVSMRDTPHGLPSTGVYGLATADDGRGGVFAGGAAQLRLVPSSAASHPSSGQPGDLFLDQASRLWFCAGDTSWKQLA